MEKLRSALVLFLVAHAVALFGARPAQATTDEFSYTGATQSWVVPAGVTSASFLLFGGSGGDNTGGSIGGHGGSAQATIAVTPGETIEVNVGGAGLMPVGPAGGLGGGSPGGGVGGPGGSSIGTDNHGGGTGGGSSDIRQGGTSLADRKLVAGGGGGAGGTSNTCGGCGAVAAGGDGGDSGTDSSAGKTDPDDPVPGGWYGGCGGGGASSVAAGAGATFITNVCGLSSPSGLQGGSGPGGSGGSTAKGGGGGGGGGGGFFGGGGGGGGGPNSGGGGGGGGSNFGPPGAVLLSGTNLGDGSVSITYQAAGDFQPDELIKAPSASSFDGDGVYNATGLDQTASAKIAAGTSAKFKIKVQNDGGSSDTLTLLGCGSTPGFTVKYTRSGKNVTAQVTAGTYSTGVLSSGGERDLVLKIKASSLVAAGTTKVCRLTSTSAGDGTKSDTVKAKVKVK